MPTLSSPARTKIVLAVHGIGDQVRNETALSTAIRFCDYYDYPGMLSLGSFYGALEHGQPALFPSEPPSRPGFSGVIGFGEIHWADIARAVSEEQYTLQETKAWALSIVNRVRVLAAEKMAREGVRPRGPAIDYPRIRLVLEEMIEAIGVLESLLFLGRKAGLVDFDLKKLLDAFLGDVQIVAEFAPIRARILKKFHEVLGAAAADGNADIFLVAHSEGTVVTFLGLLEACDNPAAHPWIRQVRGLMTLGSPIDKHLILWPALFEKFKGPHASAIRVPSSDLPVAPPTSSADPRIRWINYVDYSDPVGFELDTAREWIDARGYNQVFNFSDKDDFAFYRYPVPGKAHVDYWNDPEVFAHFIRQVVAPEAAPVTAAETQKPKGPPSKAWVPLVSYGVGYLLPLIAVLFGVYVLCRAVYNYIDPTDEILHPNFIWCVLGLSSLVVGLTVWLRLVRLTRTWGWFLLGALIYLAGAVGFWLCVGQMDGDGLNELTWLEAPGLARDWPLGVTSLAGSALLVLTILVFNSRVWRRKSASSS
jgi:hypothetical protein